MTNVKTPNAEAAQPSGEGVETWRGRPRKDAPRRWTRSVLPDVLGISWVLSAAVAMLSPAILGGPFLGPFDLLSNTGLSAHPISAPIHSSGGFDQIAAFIPWVTTAWTQIHHGHLPLWNPYNGLGMPLAFNMQSGVFSIPALISYLGPLRYAYTIQIFVTLAVAGTGAYFLGRVLGNGVVACAFSGTVFELGGPIAAWLGWPLTSVFSWAGWIFGAAILIAWGRHRMRDIAFFALVVACSVYAGDPEILLILGIALLVFISVFLAWRHLFVSRSDRIVRPIFDLTIGTLTGALLSAPLAMPGLQFLSQSSRASAATSGTHPLSELKNLIFQGFDGLPIAGGHYLVQSSYYETAAYVGIIAVVLAATALALRWRSPAVMGFSAVVVVSLMVVFVAPVTQFIQLFPVLSSVLWYRALMPVALGVAVLSGVGIDVLVRRYSERKVLFVIGAGFATAGLVLLTIWEIGRGHLDSVGASVRNRSFLWPFLEVLIGVVAIGVLLLFPHRGQGSKQLRRALLNRGQVVAGIFLAVESMFLITAGAPLWSSSSVNPPPTAEEIALARIVGSDTVGFGGGDCFFGSSAVGSLGIVPDFNIVRGVHELADYDPAIPNSYYLSWFKTTGTSAAAPSPLAYLYCPKVTTTALARLYGVTFVLEAAGAPGPQGAVFVKHIGNESLYRVPGAAEATLAPLRGRDLPNAFARGKAIAVAHPDDGSWLLHVNEVTPAVLRLRLADIPGWQASIDGKPLELERFAGIMLQAKVPAGPHTIKLTYWPRGFTVGIVLAVFTVMGLTAAVVISRFRHRKRVGAGIASRP